MKFVDNPSVILKSKKLNLEFSRSLDRVGNSLDEVGNMFYQVGNMIYQLKNDLD